MPGRPPWSQAGTEGGGQTVAMTERPEIVKQDVSQTVSVAAGSTEVVEVYAPTGGIYSVRHLRMKVSADGNATSGEHTMQLVSTAGNGTGIRATTGTSNYNSTVSFYAGEWYSADVSQGPTDGGALQAKVGRTKATETEPIQLKYMNNTDAAQDNERQLRVVLEEVSY